MKSDSSFGSLEFNALIASFLARSAWLKWGARGMEYLVSNNLHALIYQLRPTNNMATEIDTDITREDFTNYILYRAYDTLSDGQYKKLVVRCKDNGDAWAIKLYSTFQTVNNTIKSILNDINSLHEYGKTRLQRVCSEITSCIIPPCRVKCGHNTCMITGIHINECIDLTRPGKSDTSITIHCSFQHFVLMLWFACKIEHIVKVLTRHWLHTKGAEYSASTHVRQICSDFEKENTFIPVFYDIFKHALSHVRTSLHMSKTTTEFKLTLKPDNAQT